MTEPPNAQTLFLQALIQSKTPVTLFLTSGVKLQGGIAAHDDYTLILERGNQTQLIYKHAVATIVPVSV